MGRRLSKRQALDKVSADFFGVALPLESYFGDVLFGVYENKPGVICAAIGVIASCLFMVYSVFQEHWPAGKILDVTAFAVPTAACVAASILLLFLVGFAKIHRRTPGTIVALLVSGSLLVLDCYIYYREYGGRVVTSVTSSQLSRLYLLAIGIVGLLIAFIYSLKALCVHTVRYSSIMAQAFDYVRILISARSTAKSREGITYGVSLHPSFQVVSSTSDPHLRVRAAFRPGREVKIDHIFIEHKDSEKLARQDSDMSAYDIDDIAARDMADNLNLIAAHHSAISTSPPVFIILGAILGFLWVLYIALATYASREPTGIKDVAHDMEENAKDLTAQWDAAMSALQALNIDMQALAANSTNTTLNDAMESFYTLSATMATMNETVLSASNDLHDYSDWMTSLYHSISLALTIGALIAFPIIAAAALLPLFSSSNIRRQLQKGVWKDPRPKTSTPGELVNSNGFLMPLYMGSQLGTLAIAFCVLTGACAIVALVIIFPASRNFLWSWRWYLLGLKLLFILGVGLLSFFNALPTSNRRASITHIVLSFYHLLSGQWWGFYRFVFFVFHSCFTWARVDVPLFPAGGSDSGIFDMGYNAYIGIIYGEHCRRNPIVVTAVNIFKSFMSRPTKKPRVVNRWHLAYTLVKNPSLIPYRRRARPVGHLNVVSIVSSEGSSDVTRPPMPPNGSLTSPRVPRERHPLQLSSISMESDAKHRPSNGTNGHHPYSEASRHMLSNVDDDEKSIHSYHPPQRTKGRVPRASLSSVTNQGTAL